MYTNFSPLASSVSVGAQSTVPVVPSFGRSLHRRLVLPLAAALLAMGGVAPVWAQGAEPFLGQMALFPYNFCPRGWTEAAGQTLSIAQDTALFSLLGTTYGGDGRTTFALPDLRGRTPISVAQGPGLSNISLGEVAGTENVTLLQTQMPMHQHATVVSNEPATHATPGAGMALGQSMNAGAYVAAVPNTALASATSGWSGGNQPFGIRNPYLGMQWCISLQGIFPSRN